MGTKKILVADVEPLIEEWHGNVSTIAKRLGVSRSTVYARIHESVTLQRKLKDARQTMIDNAESALYNAILSGNITAIIFFLKTQAKDRGYIERTEQEISGPGGAAIQITGLDDTLKRVYRDQDNGDEGTE